MLLYALVFPVIAVIAIVWFIARYMHGKNSLSTVVMWSIFWIFVILFSAFPEFSTLLASIFGITRGLDFVIILVFIILFYTILKMYFLLDEMQDNLNKMVKEVALSNELTLDDEEE